MTVAIGQYLPGHSLLHRADPRTKLLLAFAYMVLVLLTNSWIGYAVVFVYLAAALAAGRIRPRYVLRSLKPVFVLLLFTVVLNVFFYRGETVLWSWRFLRIYREGISFSLRMGLRIIFLVIGISVVTYTTTSVMLTDGIESLLSPLKILHFPAHDVAMMMSIALRFVPTFAEETERIIKAQTARGADFGHGNLIARIRGFVPILVPLFISAWRRAEDLANAMNARCYRGGDGRTRFRTLRFTKADALAAAVSAVFAGAVIGLRIYFAYFSGS